MWAISAQNCRLPISRPSMLSVRQLRTPWKRVPIYKRMSKIWKIFRLKNVTLTQFLCSKKKQILYVQYEIFPNVAVSSTIFFCKASTNCSAERSFSFLKRMYQWRSFKCIRHSGHWWISKINRRKLRSPSTPFAETTFPLSCNAFIERKLFPFHPSLPSEALTAI